MKQGILKKQYFTLLRMMGIGALILFANSMIAQSITGTITNTEREPLIGAYVVVKGTSTGTTTDLDGKFMLDDVAAGAILTISYTGYVDMEVAASNNLAIVLEQGVNLDEVVVTGVFDPRTRLEASAAISVLKTEDIKLVAATSGTDYLKNVPGVFINQARGEIANQISVRGFQPSGAFRGYYYVSMQEDGLPIHNVNYATDYFLRPDVMTSRIEAVRGGSAAVTSANAPGGIFNYISKTGGDTFGGEARVKLGLEGNGKNLYTRFDLGFGGPLSQDKSLTYYVGGFYRNSKGARDAGYPANNGGQIRANILKTYDKGSFKVYVKALNDHNAQAAYIPTVGWEDQDIPNGFSWTDSYDAPSVQFNVPLNDGNIDFDTETKIHSQDYAAGLSWTHELGEGFFLRADAKYSDKDVFHQGTNLVTPLRIDDHDSYRLPGLGRRSGVFTFRDLSTGQVLGSVNRMVTGPTSANFELMDGNNFPGINNSLLFMPAFMTNKYSEDLMGQLSLSKEVKNMTFTVGGYFADTYIGYLGNGSGSAIGWGTIQNQPSLVDISYVDAQDGQTYQVTNPDGFMRLDEIGQPKGDHDQTMVSLFFSHEWQISDKLNLDWGVRRESVKNTGTLTPAQRTNGRDDRDFGGVDGNPLTLYDNFGGVLDVDNAFDYDFSANYTSISAALNYQIDDNQAIYVRYSNGGKSGDINTFFSFRDPMNVGTSEEDLIQDIQQFEIAYKFVNSRTKIFITPFQSRVKDIANIQIFLNPNRSLYLPPINFNSIKSTGVEFEGQFELTGGWGVKLSGLFQSAKLDDYKAWIEGSRGPDDDVIADYSGNNTGGVPPVMLNVGPTYKKGKLSAALNLNYISSRPANAPNGFDLKAVSNMDLNAAYRINDNFSVQFNVTNLLNSQGSLEWLADGSFPTNRNVDRITADYARANPNLVFSTLRNMPRAFFTTFYYQF